MELKGTKNVLCLIVVGLSDLHACGQSDVMSVERRGCVWWFTALSLPSKWRRGKSMWVMHGFKFRVSPLSLSPSLSQSWSFESQLVSSTFFWSALQSRNLSFVSFFSSDWIKLDFLCFLLQRWRIGQKITFNYFYFWQISLTFHYAVILCTDTPFYNFEESLSTDNIYWMLSWAIVAINILCVW